VKLGGILKVGCVVSGIGPGKHYRLPSNVVEVLETPADGS
jgi:hypothetical protein